MSVIGYIVVNRNAEREFWWRGTAEGEERFRSPTTGDRNWQKRGRTVGNRRTKNGEDSRKNIMDRREYCTTIRGAKAGIATKKNTNELWENIREKVKTAMMKKTRKVKSWNGKVHDKIRTGKKGKEK